jgi:hypothetical protein
MLSFLIAGASAYRLFSSGAGALGPNIPNTPPKLNTTSFLIKRCQNPLTFVTFVSQYMYVSRFMCAYGEIGRRLAAVSVPILESKKEDEIGASVIEEAVRGDLGWLTMESRVTLAKLRPYGRLCRLSDARLVKIIFQHC